MIISLIGDRSQFVYRFYNFSDFKVHDRESIRKQLFFSFLKKKNKKTKKKKKSLIKGEILPKRLGF